MANPKKNTGPKVESPLDSTAIKASIEAAYDEAAAAGGTSGAISVSKSWKHKWQTPLLVAQKKQIVVTLPLKLLVVLGYSKSNAEAIAKELVAQGGYAASQIEQVSPTPATPEVSSVTPPADQAGVSNQLERILGTEKNIYREAKFSFAKPYTQQRGGRTVNVRFITLRIPPVVPLSAIGIFAYHLNVNADAEKKLTKLISERGVTYQIPKTLEHVKKIAEELAKGS